MTAAEMLALADRCEKASGPDRELDSLIAPVQGLRVKQEGHPLGRCCYDVNGGLVLLPRYTASLDAAMTLVPEGMHWEVRSTILGRKDDPPSAVIWWKPSDPRVLKSSTDRTFSDAATPALALCAAALRAHAALLQADQPA